ncbi:type IV pilus biogenesis/stability protein PilW [Nitrogeniibacter mangrovi]|uniref:Type IV pilus biogenesis/stability protein PilW n=1 Tax=Nitrogeniibacter mangrovi TaxID=2016596 RepID=A0A6C1B8K4_9RHOO|nr:type IV pilus biogenesis/stability protein PilW [Nitrogeniibacter mangrovi]QID18584.1 type IV pilus biogenesis/stability protein PilW [Nitrogeniibacter mangrovi]
MRSRNVPVLVVALALALAGCTSNPVQPSSSSSAEFQRPAADRPVTSEAQKRAKAHVDLGTAYYTSGRFGTALDEADTALADDDSYAPAHHLKALVLMALDDVANARVNFERAAQLAPGDPDINNSYGWFLCVQKQYDAGLQRLDMAARNPYYTATTRPLTNSGLCLAMQGKDAEAETYFRRAVQADPDNMQALLNLAAIAYRRKNYEAAHAYLNTAHQRGQASPESLWLGVRVEHMRGDRDAEASYVSQLKSRFPTSPQYQKLIEGNYE